jgi:hypothetical protein
MTELLDYESSRDDSLLLGDYPPLGELQPSSRPPPLPPPQPQQVVAQLKCVVTINSSKYTTSEDLQVNDQIHLKHLYPISFSDFVAMVHAKIVLLFMSMGLTVAKTVLRYQIEDKGWFPLLDVDDLDSAIRNGAHNSYTLAATVIPPTPRTPKKAPAEGTQKKKKADRITSPETLEANVHDILDKNGMEVFQSATDPGYFECKLCSTLSKPTALKSVNNNVQTLRTHCVRTHKGSMPDDFEVSLKRKHSQLG